MHTHGDGTRHHDHDDVDLARHAGVVHRAVNHTVRGGPPVLDIGGDIGAMVVLMDPATAGTELQLRSEHEPPIAVHTGVWNRPHGAATITAAVFPELVTGSYWVLDPGGHDVRSVAISGGELTEIDLRAPIPVSSSNEATDAQTAADRPLIG